MSVAGVSLADVLAAASGGLAPIAPETAGYFALGLADLLLDAPVRFDETSCGLTDDGTVALDDAARFHATAVDAERSVRRMLGMMLDVANGGASPSLALVAERGPGAGIAALVRELEGALIPVNRAAARRALARLARESLRARQEGRLARPAAARRVAPARPEPAAPDATEVAPPVEHRADETDVVAPVETSERPPPSRHRGRADELLSRFTASESRSAAELSLDLKRMAGLEPTPPPPAPSPETTDPPSAEPSDAAPTPSVDAAPIVAAGDRSDAPEPVDDAPAPRAEVDEPPAAEPPPLVLHEPPARSRAWMAWLLVVLVAAAVVAWRVARARLVH